MSRLLLLYPRRWRRRFGAEVDQLLTSSKTPVADRLDLLLAAPRVWLDNPTTEGAMDVLVRLRLVSAAVLGAGTALSAVAVAQLRDGLRELPLHWWSGGAVGLALLGVAGLVGAWAVTRAPDRA